MTQNEILSEQYVQLFRKILRIRLVEEAIATRYSEAKMRCPVHFSIGQEAAAVMVCENLRVTDLAVSTHRAHAHYLAKGGSLPRFIAELYGKSTGCTEGRGGSMNLSDLSAGFVASTSIVGNSIPVGVGLAFAQHLKKEDAVTCIFLGDAAVEEGVFYESLNFAVLKKLPVIFVCENNLYSVNTPLSLRQPTMRTIVQLAEGIGAKVERLDGNDTWASFKAIRDIMEDLRKNGGVWFLELQTYRYKVHCGPEDDCHPERPREELEFWLSRDPVLLLQNQLIQVNAVSLGQIEDWRCTINREIEASFVFAENSPYPAATARFDYLYAKDQSEWLKAVLARQNHEVSVE